MVVPQTSNFSFTTILIIWIIIFLALLLFFYLSTNFYFLNILSWSICFFILGFLFSLIINDNVLKPTINYNITKIQKKVLIENKEDTTLHIGKYKFKPKHKEFYNINKIDSLFLYLYDDNGNEIILPYSLLR